MATKTKKKTTARQRPGLDWSLTPRTPAGAATMAVLAMPAATGVGNAFGLPPALGMCVGMIGIAGTFVSSANRLTSLGLSWRASVLLSGGGWLSWSLATGPLHQANLISLGLGAALAATTSRLGRALPKSKAAAVKAASTEVATLHAGGTTGAMWAHYILRATNMHVIVTRVEAWENKAGFTLHALLPADGRGTLDTIKASTNLLAQMARLPRGCGVEPDEGDEHRGELILRVSTVNKMDDLIEVEEDYSPLSILEGLPIGGYRDGDPVQIFLRELSLLLVGFKGSGKTNLLDLITLCLIRCTDAVVWHIDLNGGGMSQLWLHPWLEGDVERPVIDWAAASEDEALLMTEVALAIAKSRKRTGRKIKVSSDSKLLPISGDLPEIVIMVDEGKEVLSPQTRNPKIAKIRDNLQKITDIARNEAVNVVASALRCTSTTVSTDLRAQMGIKIGMRVQAEAELAYLFGWTAKLSMKEIPTKGCAFIQAEGGENGEADVPRPFKAGFLPPKRITTAATLLAEVRPDLDDAAALLPTRIIINDEDPRHPQYATVADIYAGRYERMRTTFLALDDATDDDEDADAAPGLHLVPATAHAQAPVPAGAAAGPGFPRSTADAWADPQDLRRAAAQGVRTIPATTARSGPVVVQAVRLDTPDTPSGPVHPVPQLLRAALAAFGKDDRIHSEDLAAQLGLPSKHQLAELLGSLGVNPRPNAFERGGERLRGYDKADLHQAVRLIQDGQLTVPAQVTAWAS